MLPLLFPEPTLRLDRVVIADRAVSLALRAMAPLAPCPACRLPTGRVHSRYTRRVSDLPIAGRATTLLLSVRRFFCANDDCPRRVFCERLPRLLEEHARASTRLIDAQRDLGLALGGEPGARLAAKLAMPTSPDTLLRRVKQTPAETGPDLPRRVVGVDDWALRKGQTCGEVVELLPGRDGTALKTWLGKHPEVEVLARDRWVAFADAATEAAPQAKPVADRFHLFKNVREALEHLLDRYGQEIRQAFPDPAQPTTPIPAGDPNAPPAPATERPAEAASDPPPVAPVGQRALTARQQRRLDRYHEVRRRHGEGQSPRRIAAAVGLSKGAVSRYLRSDRCPDWRPGRAAASLADGYQERIDAWLADGNRNVAELHRQLEGEVAGLGYDALRRFVTKRLAIRGEQGRADRHAGQAKRRRRRVNAARPKPRPPPSAKSLSFAVIARPDDRTEKQQDRVGRLRAIGPEVAEAVDLVEAFAALLRKQGEATLTAWHEKAVSGSRRELARFARGLEPDWAAVQAAVEGPWSSGAVEGHVGRLKAIKRAIRALRLPLRVSGRALPAILPPSPPRGWIGYRP